MDFLKNYWVDISPMLPAFAKKILILAGIIIGGIILKKALIRSIYKANSRFDRFDATLVPILKSLISYGVYLVMLVFILDSLGVSLGSLLAILGAAGLAVGLALKDTLGNIASGIMILLLKPFKVGHFIDATSTAGTVKEIGLFSTTLETPDGLYVMAPNSSLWGSPIKNITRNGRRRMDLIVGISYTDSIDKGFEVLLNHVKSEPRFLPDPAPQVMVLALADSSINLQLRVWAKIEDYWPTYWDSNKKIKEEIEAAGLTIPFPQQDIHMS